MKILLVEDDPALKSLLERVFEDEDWVVESADSGDEGLYMAEINRYDVIVLDWMLPNLSGIEILKRLRSAKNYTPVLMLTAKSDVSFRVEGLKEGADDYLPKPFSVDELIERIKALYRRSLRSGGNIIKEGILRVDLDSAEVFVDNIKVELKKKEYELLLFLLKYKGSPVSNRMIEEQLWDSESLIQSNVIQVTIYNLRKKIGKDLIKTSRGLGYILNV